MDIELVLDQAEFGAYIRLIAAAAECRPAGPEGTRHMTPAPSSTPATRSRCLRSMLIAAAASGTLLAAIAPTATAAAASGGTIGTFRLSGQMSGTLKVVQSGTAQDLVNFFGVKLPLGGHTTAETSVELAIAVTTEGKTESLGKSHNSWYSTVTLSVVAGGKNYNWESFSGTASLKAHGDGGSVDASLEPAGKHLDDPIASGKATGTIHLSGSFSSCHSG
jgi:hypothetical protein